MTELVLPKRTYRLVDGVTKLVGVGLLAGALEVGIVSALGLALTTVGVLLGVSTVFVSETSR